MPKFTKEIEEEIRGFLSNKALGVLPDLPTFITPYYWRSQQEFAGMIKEDFDTQFKVNYLIWTLTGFRDSKTKGCDEDPSVFILYKAQLFKEFEEAIDGKPNSHDEIVDQMITLRNRFLVSREIQMNHITHSGLFQLGPIQAPRQSEHIFENCVGEWFNFQVEVEIN